MIPMTTEDLKEYKRNAVEILRKNTQYATAKAVELVFEKQIPKKPIFKYHKESVTPVKYGRLIEFLCPNCGRLVVATHERDVENGGGIHKALKGCSTCLQAIDFTGYYHIDKLDEEVDFKE